MEEIWKPVLGYENIYSVSSFGRIRRELKTCGTQPGRIVNSWMGTDGYFKASLSSKSKVRKFSVHSLVAQAFIGVRMCGFEVNHKDSIRTNNNISNLEYISYQDNSRHNGITNGCSKLTEEDVRQIRQKYVPGTYSQYRLAREFNVQRPTIHKVLKRISWDHVI